MRVLPYNSTYSLPISASWDPATVSLKLVDKGDAPVYNRPSLWPATDNQSFFSFNGDISYALDYEITGYDPPASAQLWHFEPDGSGGGTWKLLSVAPSTVTQSVGGALAVAKDSAYMLGGIENWRTSYKLYGDVESSSSADGILSYNMDNQTWENRTMTPFVPNGWFVEGQLQHLTGFANDSLLLAMGGDTALPLGFYTGQTAIPYDTVTIYNTETKEWRSQTNTGDIPNGHIGGSCWVGVPGDNGTYEVCSRPRMTEDLSEKTNLGRSSSMVVLLALLPTFSRRSTLILTESPFCPSHRLVGIRHLTRPLTLYAYMSCCWKPPDAGDRWDAA